MKRYIFAISALLLILVLAFWGNLILARSLDARLPPLLTRVLGLPVEIAPMKAHLLQLTATTPSLVMGDAGSPAVVASNVKVSISLQQLLRGEIRLVFASADDLMVQVSRWPSSDGPPSTDYLFLDQWLPTRIQLGNGSYVIESGDSYPLQEVQWQRNNDGSATVDASHRHSNGNIALTAELDSLHALLTLAPIELDLSSEAEGQPDSSVSLKTSIAPGDTAAYLLRGELVAQGINAQINASGQAPWTLPEQSQTSISALHPGTLTRLYNSYKEPGAGQGFSSLLTTSVPRLQLPGHTGVVQIDTIELAGEVGKDTRFEFTTGEQGLQVSSLVSHGPTGVVNGSFGVTDDGQEWQVKLDAILKGKSETVGIGAEFIDTQWYWRTGEAALAGKGGTWGKLINNLGGNLTLAGNYDDKEQTPINISARLDKDSGDFSLENLSIELGSGVLHGSAKLIKTRNRPKLQIDLKGERLALDFLVEDDPTENLPGLPLPEFLAFFPDLDADWKLDIVDLEAPGVSVARATGSLHRNEQGGRLELDITGKPYGQIDLTLDAKLFPDKPGDYKLQAKLTQLDIPGMFRQAGLFYGRTSGTMEFTSTGQNIKEIFEAMRGTADLDMDMRSDNNWERAPEQNETLEFGGDASVVVTDERIVGLKIQNLDIGSFEQDLTGNVSIISGRSPWLIADLESEMLNVTGLLDLMPQSSEEADRADLLPALRQLGAAEISLDVDSLTISETPLSQLRLKLVSATDLINLERLDLTKDGNSLEGKGKITWRKDSAAFEGSARLLNVDLDRFLIHDADFAPVPVSGTAAFASSGNTVSDMLANLTGHIDLEATHQSGAVSPKLRRKLVMEAKRLPQGMAADIKVFQWGTTELTGSLRYQNTTPADVEIELNGGTLSLLAWENAVTGTKDETAAEEDGTGLGKIAKTSAGFVGDILLAPMRMFSDDDKTQRGAKIFSSEPLPLAGLSNMKLRVRGRIDELLSNVVQVSDLKIDTDMHNGHLNLTSSAGTFNGGTAEVKLVLDTNTQPPAAQLTGTFKELRSFSNMDTYPRSLFVSVESQGVSTAELAANLNGLAYLELGRGPVDYGNTALLSADIASGVFRTLIPGAERVTPELNCGVTVALFKDGTGVTPYGIAARTNQANLLGQIEVDLAKETVRMNVDARSNEGVGVSIGSVFSNTVQIRGTLAEPSIVPNATSIIWRGWAAVMTGGLSVLGESLFHRVISSDKPCASLQDAIREDLCPKNPLAASSSMVCPQG